MDGWLYEIRNGCPMCWFLTLFIPFAVAVMLAAIVEMVRGR